MATVNKRIVSSLLAVLMLLVLSACGGSSRVVSSSNVTVQPSTTATTVQPGSSSSVVISGVPAGDLVASSVTLSFTGNTSAASQSAPNKVVGTFTTTGITVINRGNGVWEVFYDVPPGITVSSQTIFTLIVNGITSAGNSFSSQPTNITISPAARIVTLSPNGADRGTTVDVAITAANSNFVQGTTTANFGIGASVNGAADGQPGTVTVSSANQATARVVISSTASVGTRDVLVNTNGQRALFSAGFTIRAANRAPVANAGGPYSGISGQAVTFSSTGSSDPDGDQLSFSWNFGDNTTGTGASPTHTYAAPGTYVVALTVSDGRGGTASANATATIAAPNRAPVAAINGPYVSNAGVNINFSSAGSSDPDGDTLSFAWSFGDGGTSTSANPTYSYVAPGTFTVSLTVSDGRGLSNTATTTATIGALNRNPVANPGGPYGAAPGQSITFSAAGSSDPDGDPLTFSWTFGDGGTATGVGPSHTYAAAGTYTVTLNVSDGRGGTASATVSAVVRNTNTAPVANPGGPYIGVINLSVSFSGAASSDPDGDALTYSWNFGDSGTGTGVAPTHTYTSAGNFNVALTVTDPFGSSATATTTVNIAAANLNPVANAGGPYTGLTNQPVAFNGTGSSDADGDTLTYAWDFGDSGTGTGASPSHTYATAGTYTVTLTVTDGRGGSGTSTATATITRSNAVPVANPGGPYLGVINEVVTFSGAASTDADGDTLTYSWNFGDSGTATGVAPTHTYASTGTFTVTLTVTDGFGGSNTATTTANIAAANRNPVANAGGPYTGTTGQAVQFNGTASTDPDGDLLTFAWDFGDSTVGAGATTSHTYSAAGTYTIGLTVTDGRGGTSSTTATATITRANSAPVANAGAALTGNVNQVLNFDASASTDGDGDPLTFTWNFGDSSPTATGVTTTHPYTAAGTYTVMLSVNDGFVTSTATTTAVITQPAAVKITSPAPGDLFNAASIDVSGTIDRTDVTVDVNGVAAVISNGNFTATGVQLREGSNLLTATAIDSGGNAGSDVISVHLDVTAPVVRIDSPADNAVVTSEQLTVTGMINDIVTGTVNAEQVTITVNGVSAAVSNRSFSTADILLVRGSNTITVEATDRAGNIGSATARVTFEDGANQQRIVMLTGNNQTDVINAVLAEPLVVQLLGTDGSPVAGRSVTFTVRRSDGNVKALPEEGQELTVLSDENGVASVLFQLGSRTGVGVNEVVASAPGFVGDVTFSATSTVGAPDRIEAVHGTNQYGIIGAALPIAFQVIVNDVGANPVVNVPVTFTVEQGGGTIEGQSTITLNTNSDGKATAMLTLGQQEGIQNNVVSVNFQGNVNGGTTFTASGSASGPASETSVTGVVLDNANTPIPNATVKLTGTTLTTVTNADGQFTLTGAPVGTVTLSVDGSTSSRPETFPFLAFLLRTVSGQENTLGMPIYLPQVDSENSQMVGGSEEVTLTMRGVPGVAFTVAPNSVVFPDGSTVGRLSLSQVKADMVPMAPPNGSAPRVVWTLQPAGTRFTSPVRVQLPNTDGLVPGQVVEIYQFDHDLEQFVSAGTARVSPDGSVVTTDAGFGLTKAGWGGAAPPPPPKNCTISCDDNNECTSDSVNDPPCSCSHAAIDGACGGQATGANSCKDPGVCSGGRCLGADKPDGAGCDDGQFCTENDTCAGGGCKGTPIADRETPTLGNAVDLAKIFKPLEDFSKGLGNNIGFSFSVKDSAKQTLLCCEAKQLRDTAKDEFSFGVEGSISTQRLPLGAFGIPTPSGTIGLYYKVGISAGASVGGTKDQCLDNTCYSGTLSVGGSIEVGVSLDINPFIITAAGGGSIGPTIEGTVNCKEIAFKSGISALKVALTVELADGLISYSVEKELISATILAEGSIPLPQ